MTRHLHLFQVQFLHQRILQRLWEKLSQFADEVADSAKDLYSVSSRTFSKNSKGGYDTDAIYKKVSKFASDYNDFVSANFKITETSKIDSSLDSLKSYTKSNEQALSKIGITIDSKTGELSVDEKKFKSSDMANVKSLFSGTGSYAYGVSAKTSMIGYYAKTKHRNQIHTLPLENTHTIITLDQYTVLKHKI